MSNKPRKMTLEKKHNLTGWAFLAPATFLIAVFSFWPMIKALVLSFQTGKGRNMQMAGFTNYIRMFQDDVFIQSIKNTFFYFILQVPIMLVVAMVLACILNKKDLRFKGFFRTMIFLPCTTSLVAYSIIFRSLFANDGLVNYVLVNLGILDKPYNFLTQPFAAKIVIILALLWRWTGYNMVFFLFDGDMLAGYGFEIYHDKAKDAVMGVILLAMMVPFITILVPLFQMVAKMKMLNSTLGFILPTISTPFLIMMFRQSARSFPRDIIEAARLDGLSEIRIFFQMFIPTMKSTYAAAMTITFMNAWNSYMWPKVIMTQSESMTMPMVVANLTEGYVTDYGMLMLAVLICTLPTALVFFILQKSFAEGITGAVK